MNLGQRQLKVSDVTIQRVDNGWILYCNTKTFVAYTYNEMTDILAEQFSILKVGNKRVDYGETNSECK